MRSPKVSRSFQSNSHGSERFLIEGFEQPHPGSKNSWDHSSPTQSPKLCPSVHFLPGFGLKTDALVHASALAHHNGTDAATELIAAGGINETKYYRHLASHLNLQFVEREEIGQVFLRQRDPLAAIAPHTMIWGRVGMAAPCAIFAPSPRMVNQLESLVSRSNRAEQLVVTSPEILRQVLTNELENELTKHAVNHLAIASPSSSAKLGASAWQGAALTLFAGLVIAFTTMAPSAASFAIHLVVSAFFIICVLLRIVAAAQYQDSGYAALKPTHARLKSIYSIMVPLHDEAEIVPDLIDALRALKWPRSKLEIKLVCEADDWSTLLALEAQDLDGRFEIVKVPVGHPRTKPKALCYAMMFTSGQFITVYDAEDRPHPEQLLEAAQAFRNGNDNLACVQSPLVTTNLERNWLTALFHFEYAGLFGGLLPWLARRRAPLLLGGTSNHFKRSALLRVGLWDPYNVTEDADLGLRLWRHGLQTEMITRPTLEDAPRSLGVWLPQRTRWFKGWMQTWTVQMRQPSALTSNMSWRSFLITQFLLTGTIVSALFHPIVLSKAMLLSHATLTQSAENFWHYRLAMVDICTILGAYVGHIVLCWRATEPSNRTFVAKHVWLVPLYWLALSWAAWRGLYQLFAKPFYWEKTPHPPHEK